MAPHLQLGCLVRIPLGGRRVRGIVSELVEEAAEEELEAIAALIVQPPLAPPPLDQVMAWIARRYAVPLGAALDRCVPPRVRVKAPAPEAPAGVPADGRLLRYRGGDGLIRAIESGTGGVYSFRTAWGEDHGILIAELVAASLRAPEGAALVAVPEVRFGSRVLDALAESWPGVARVDSSQSDGDRSRSWLQLAVGHRLGMGGRATVLAPASPLRLIVLDEEEHPSYKEDRSPRYDARRVAMARAERHGAVCVLMSHTPSVELAPAGRRGDIQVIDQEPSAGRASLPVIETVEPPSNRILSHTLHDRIKESLYAGRAVALLAPRRGFARSVWCPSCQRSLRCPRCERGLHGGPAMRTVRCGRCGFQAPTPVSCPSCGAAGLRFMGAGSERLAEQVAKSFPRARVVRMDPELIDGAGAGDEPVDIYVTTWIGTKPTIRPPVSLVGVLDADALLRRPDWRATERAYQALVAMAEWAGPAAAGGRLIVETAEPSHYVVQALARASYDFFLQRELAQRKELGYPPFSELIRVIATGPRRAGLIERAAGIARAEGRVLGPIPVTSRTGSGAEEEGLEILVKCPDAEPVAVALRAILASVPAGNRLRVDVDPH